MAEIGADGSNFKEQIESALELTGAGEVAGSHAVRAMAALRAAGLVVDASDKSEDAPSWKRQRLANSGDEAGDEVPGVPLPLPLKDESNEVVRVVLDGQPVSGDASNEEVVHAEERHGEQRTDRLTFVPGGTTRSGRATTTRRTVLNK